MNEFNNDFNYSYTTAPEPKKKKSIKGGVALILAIAVIGGGSGFGGALLADKLAEPAAAAASDDSGKDTAFVPDISTLTTLDNTATVGTKEYSAMELYDVIKDTLVIVNNYQVPTNTASSASGYSDFSDFFSYFGGGSTQPSETQPSDGVPKLYGTGSGVVFTTDGYIITNAHVVNGAAKVTVTIDDYNDPTVSTEIEAKVIGSDTATDLAVLKVERDEAFKCAPLGNSDALKVGQDICAFGNPSNLPKTLTKGIISGLNRHYTSNAGYELSSIQIDAAINPGNSGGGLFDMYGNVVGIVNSKIIIQNEIENIGFAITINEAKPVINDLLAYGFVKNRAALGVTTVALTEYTASLYGYDTLGLLITALNEGAPVQNSGLAVGDVVTKINGTEVKSVTDVQTILRNYQPGDTVEATVVRYNNLGKAKETIVTIELTSSSND